MKKKVRMERERKLCDWLCKKVGEEERKKKKELPNIMKYNALVLLVNSIWFGYIFIVSCGMGFVSV